jgi:TetR/AcrR family transcriptional regulator, transcriptional repressor for nem operon
VLSYRFPLLHVNLFIKWSLMRYTNEYKDQARTRLVEAGGQYAKQHGFNGSGMADLAAAAGVTTGSLYKHFSGKSDLFVALISAELNRTAELYAKVDASDAAQVSRVLKGYLSLHHVNNPGTGCPLPSLTSEISRADDSAKKAFQDGLAEIHANVSAITVDSETAWAIIAQNVGAVMLARAMGSEDMQKELLAAVRKAGDVLLSKETTTQANARG